MDVEEGHMSESVWLCVFLCVRDELGIKRWHICIRICALFVISFWAMDTPTVFSVCVRGVYAVGVWGLEVSCKTPWVSDGSYRWMRWLVWLNVVYYLVLERWASWLATLVPNTQRSHGEYLELLWRHLWDWTMICTFDLMTLSMPVFISVLMSVWSSWWAHLSDHQHACMRLGGPLIYCQLLHMFHQWHWFPDWLFEIRYPLEPSAVMTDEHRLPASNSHLSSVCHSEDSCW